MVYSKAYYVDVVERFQLSIFFLIISLRNLGEVAFDNLTLEYILDVVVIPIFLVATCEVVVDWLKHAFITKFNQIKPLVYLDFLNALIKVEFNKKDDSDSDAHVDILCMSKRIGFSSIPLTCLFIRHSLQFLPDISITMLGFVRICILYCSFFLIYVMIELNMIGYINRWRMSKEKLTITKVTGTSEDANIILNTIDRFILYKSRIIQ